MKALLSTLATVALLGGPSVLGAVGMLPATITGGGSVSSSGMPDPYTPTDGEWNVTGTIKMGASGNTIGTGSGGGLSQIAFFSTAIRAQPPNTGIFQLHDGTNTWGQFIDAGSTGGISMGATAKTIADNGNGGTAAADATLPVGFMILVTCSDAQGCDWTPTESSATDGIVVNIVNTSANTLTLKHVAGQVLLNGGNDEALGQNDSLTLVYSSSASAWIQVGTTGNN